MNAPDVTIKLNLNLLGVQKLFK